MSMLPQSLPASLRKPVQTSRFAASLLAAGQRDPSTGQPAAGPVSLHAKGRFARLPHEPEDAGLTGVTRSLHRRLLALNLAGSMPGSRLRVPQSRIA